MLQIMENRKFTARFVAVVAALTGILYIALAQVLLDFQIPILLRFIGIVATTAWLVSFLLNRWLWRYKPFSCFLQIPDFSGRWEGWYRHAPKEDWRETAHEISQKALDVVAEAWGPGNWSRGTCSAINSTSPALTKELVWAYKTEQTTTALDPGGTHAGVHFLRMVEKHGKRVLRGKYINDRARNDGHKGSVGEIEVQWVSKEFQHDLNFRKDCWGMDKPKE